MIIPFIGSEFPRKARVDHMPSTKSKGRAAELAVKEWLENMGYDVHLAQACYVRYPGSKFPRVIANDIFGCIDIIAVNGAEHHYLQITAGGASATSARKRKVEEKKWSTLGIEAGIIRVAVVEVKKAQNDVDTRRMDWVFRFHRYDGAGGWAATDAVRVPVKA